MAISRALGSLRTLNVCDGLVEDLGERELRLQDGDASATDRGSVMVGSDRGVSFEDQLPLSGFMSGTASCQARFPTIGARSVNRGFASDRMGARLTHGTTRRSEAEPR